MINIIKTKVKEATMETRLNIILLQPAPPNEKNAKILRVFFWRFIFTEYGGSDKRVSCDYIYHKGPCLRIKYLNQRLQITFYILICVVNFVYCDVESL